MSLLRAARVLLDLEPPVLAPLGGDRHKAIMRSPISGVTVKTREDVSRALTQVDPCPR